MRKKVAIPQIKNTKGVIGYFYSYYCLIILFPKHLRFKVSVFLYLMCYAIFFRKCDSKLKHNIFVYNYMESAITNSRNFSLLRLPQWIEWHIEGPSDQQCPNGTVANKNNNKIHSEANKNQLLYKLLNLIKAQWWQLLHDLLLVLAFIYLNLKCL